MITSFKAKFSYIYNIGTKFYFYTDYKAPKFRVIMIDFHTGYDADKWESVVVEVIP